MQLHSKYKPHKPAKPHGTINLYNIIIVSRCFKENHCTRGTIPYTLKQDAFFEKLSRRFACKTDTSVGHYRWLNKICSVASYSSEIRSNLGACCRTDERLYSVSTGKYVTICCTNIHIYMMDKLQ